MSIQTYKKTYVAIDHPEDEQPKHEAYIPVGKSWNGHQMPLFTVTGMLDFYHSFENDERYKLEKHGATYILIDLEEEIEEYHRRKMEPQEVPGIDEPVYCGLDEIGWCWYEVEELDFDTFMVLLVAKVLRLAGDMEVCLLSNNTEDTIELVDWIQSTEHEEQLCKSMMDDVENDTWPMSAHDIADDMDLLSTFSQTTRKRG